MKRHFLSCLVLVLVLVCATVFAVACDNGSDGDAETTDAVTTGGTEAAVTTEGGTEAPTPELPLDLPADAAAVDALIASIDGATIENEADIDLAYLGYCALSESEKAKVTGYETLQDLRYELTKAYVVKEYMDTRIPHNELLIGAYVCQQPQNAHVKLWEDSYMQDMVDCHIDFAWQVGLNADIIAQYTKYGIGIFEWTGNIGLPGVMSDEDFRTATAGRNYDYEPLWAFYQVDEPGNGDKIRELWPNGKIIAEEILPDCAINMTLLPLCGRNMPTYEPDYAEVFAQTVQNDFICFDHYIYNGTHPANMDGNYEGWTGSNNLACYLDNLEIIGRLCQKYDRDLYPILQLFSHEENGFLTTEQLKFQAYSSMAYGAKSLSWACWIEGWGHGNVLDNDGNKTEMYDKVKETNADLKALEPVYMRYTAASNAVISRNYATSQKIDQYHGNTELSGLTQTSLTDLEVQNKSAMIIGHFEKNVGEGEAFMFVGCNNYLFSGKDAQVSSITFKTADPDAIVTAYVKGIATLLVPDADGVYTVSVIDADGVFVTVE